MRLAPAAGLVATLALLASQASAQSQATGGAIEGTVTDAQGGVLPGVNIAVKNVATGVTRSIQTDAHGLYRAPLLPVGAYDVTASLAGFATLRRPGLPLTLGQTLVADMTLSLATAQEEVTVTAEAPLIESARTQQSSTVGAIAVANLPVNGRNFIDFVLTTPGVVRDVRGGDVSFAGQRGTLNSVVIDGADNNNTFFGQSLGRTGSGRAPYQFSQDAVQEFQVNRNAYSAEYGRAGGAVINVVTKSGANDFHGSAFEFFRDKGLNGNSYANKVRTPIPPRSPFRVQQFGASLSGPLERDKGFFFVSYDGQRQTIPNEVVLTVPGGLPSDPLTQSGLQRVTAKTGNYDLTRNQDVFLAKIDYQLSPEHRLSVRYNHQNFTGGNSENSGAQNAEEHSGDSLVRTRTINASVSSIFSPTLYNELRAQWAQDSEPGLANTNDPEVNVSQSGQRLLTFGRNNFSPRETTIKRWEIGDTLTWTLGSHQLKAGGDFLSDSILNFFPGFFGGSYTFQSLASFARGVPNGTGEFFQQNFPGLGTTGAETHPDSKEIALFALDDWKATKELTVSIGLRYDRQQFAQPAVRNPDAQLLAAGIDTSVIHTDNNNFGPRLGLAWTPDKKVVVRAGYGLFFGRTPAIMVGTAHSNNGINVVSVTLSGSQLPTYPNVLPAPPTGVGARPNIFFFDGSYESPEVHQASAGVDYALADDLALSGSYLFVAGRKLQRSVDVNIGPAVTVDYPIQGGGSLAVDTYPTRRFANFGRVIAFQSSARSNYNGFTLELRRRLRGHFQGSLAYTLGKVKDTVPDATAVVPGNAGDDSKYISNPGNFEADDAPGNDDVRHRLVFSGYWETSYFSDGLAKTLLNNWSLSWIASIQSGFPYSAQVSGGDLNRDGNPSNDIVPGSRNSYRLPAQRNVDLRLSRRIPLGNKARLELIGEAFNLLNSTIVTNQQRTFYRIVTTSGVTTLIPQLSLSNPRLNFGFDSAAADARIVQLAAKVTF
jgi:outer membrane receptor protein involved in Fe transport